MMRTLSSLCLLLVPSMALARLELFTDGEAWGYSEPVPIYHYAKDWQAELQSGSDGFLYQRYRLGLRAGPYEFARISQVIYEVEPSRDTARLYHRVKNDLPFTAGERFALHLRARHAAMHGIQFGHIFRTLDRRLSLHPSLNLWWANSLLDGEIRGSAVARDDSRFDYRLALDYTYSEDKLLDRHVAHPSGRGASLDLRARYEINQAWYLKLQAEDVIGRLHWNDAPFTRGRAASDNREFDEEGFVHFNPTFSGREGSRDFDQRLPLRASFAAGVFHGPFVFEGFVRTTPLRSFAGALAAWQPYSELSLGLEMISPGPAYGLRVEWRGLFLAYAADASSFKDARRTSLSLGFRWSPPVR